MTRFFVQNFGCRATQADGAALEAQLAGRGLRSVEERAEADLVILNTCTVTAEADSDARSTIRRVHRDYGYVTDPHTACAFKDLTPGRSRVVLATASPAKFPETIRAAIGIEPTHPALEALKSRPVVKHRLRAAKGPIQDFIAAHAV